MKKTHAVPVIPAKAGNHFCIGIAPRWIPAFAGMTKPSGMTANIVLVLILMLTVSPPGFAVSFFDESQYRPLISDQKAYLPGDLLTVIVLETANAETATNLSSNKNIKASLEAGLDEDDHEVSFGLKGEGKSAAKTGRNGKIKAAITAKVVETLDGGRYRIQGRQHIQINGEIQTIILTGVVRTQDITPQNTILSTRLADAHITYTGLGAVSDSQRHNYIYKALSWLGLV